MDLSTMETEIVAFPNAAKEAGYLDMLLNQVVKLGIKLSITIYEDDEACIAIVNNPNTSTYFSKI